MSNEKAENYILPETERTIRRMISVVQRVYEFARIICGAIYLIFLGLRSVFFSRALWLDIVLFAIFGLQFILLILEFLGKIKSNKFRLILFRIKMVPSLIMLILVCYDIFSDLNRLMPWQLIMVIFMGMGWLILLTGDLFSLCVPTFTEMLLESFKHDIETKGILKRAGNELKEAAYDKAKNIFNAESMGEVAAKAGGLFFGGVGGVYILDKIARHAEAKKNEETEVSDETVSKVAKEFEKYSDKDYSSKEIENVLKHEGKITKRALKGALSEYGEVIKLLIEMIKDYFQGKYTVIPKKTIGAIIGTLLYILSPLDIIGDFIPVLGLVDDALAVGFCLKAAAEDIEAYKKWKEACQN